MMLRLDAAVSKRSTFSFSLLYTRKICKGGDKLEEVIQFSEDIRELFLVLYCSDPKVQHLPETEGIECFQKSEAQLIPSAVNKELEN